MVSSGPVSSGPVSRVHILRTQFEGALPVGALPGALRQGAGFAPEPLCCLLVAAGGAVRPEGLGLDLGVGPGGAAASRTAWDALPHRFPSVSPRGEDKGGKGTEELPVRERGGGVGRGVGLRRTQQREGLVGDIAGVLWGKTGFGAIDLRAAVQCSQRHLRGFSFGPHSAPLVYVLGFMPIRPCFGYYI